MVLPNKETYDIFQLSSSWKLLHSECYILAGSSGLGPGNIILNTNISLLLIILPLYNVSFIKNLINRQQHIFQILFKPKKALRHLSVKKMFRRKKHST